MSVAKHDPCAHKDKDSWTYRTYTRTSTTHLWADCEHGVHTRHRRRSCTLGRTGWRARWQAPGLLNVRYNIVKLRQPRTCYRREDFDKLSRRVCHRSRPKTPAGRPRMLIVNYTQSTRVRQAFKTLRGRFSRSVLSVLRPVSWRILWLVRFTRVNRTQVGNLTFRVNAPYSGIPNGPTLMPGSGFWIPFKTQRLARSVIEFDRQVITFSHDHRSGSPKPVTAWLPSTRRWA